MKSRAVIGIALALVAAGLYGFVPNFVRGALQNGVPAIESTLFRTYAIGFAFAILAVAQGQRLSVPRAAVPSFLVQCVATFMVSTGYLGSVQFIDVGLAAIIFYFFPVLIMIAAPVAEGRNPGVWRIAIAVLAFIGLAVAIGPRFDTLDIRGIMLALTATFGATLQFFSGRSISAHMTPPAFGSLVHIAILPPVLGIALFVGDGKLQFLPGGTANGWGLLFMAALAGLYVVGYLLHMSSLRFAPASTVAPFYNLEPVVATVAAVMFLGERQQINQYVGGGLVLVALLLSSVIEKRKK